MKIINGRFLDKNNYNSVLISGSAITYNCEHEYETASNENRFSSSLKDLTDEEKKSEVIKHYLRNSTVMSINEADAYRGKPCITLNGSRILRTYIPVNIDDKRAILKKYESDRLNMIYKENYDSVHISMQKGNSECYLYKEDDFSKELSLYITLCSNKETLSPRELEFLKKLIPFLMGDSLGRYKEFCAVIFNYARWIGNGISDINHDIICSHYVEKIVLDIWTEQRSNKEREECRQITIDEYVKRLK